MTMLEGTAAERIERAELEMEQAAARESGERTNNDLTTPIEFLAPLAELGRVYLDPCSNPWSMIAHSTLLIVTGGALMPSTHEPSHGAGQTRPVNSGKLFVLCSRSSASRQRPR